MSPDPAVPSSLSRPARGTSRARTRIQSMHRFRTVRNRSPRRVPRSAIAARPTVSLEEPDERRVDGVLRSPTDPGRASGRTGARPGHTGRRRPQTRRDRLKPPSRGGSRRPRIPAPSLDSGSCLRVNYGRDRPEFRGNFRTCAPGPKPV